LPGPGRNGFLKVYRAETLDDGLAGKWKQMPMTYELAGVVRPENGSHTDLFHCIVHTIG
jgi:hypothetical protein